MTDKEFGILVLRAVICGGIEDELGVRLRTPFADRLDLGGPDFLVHLGIAVLGAQSEALEELAASSLALLGPREVHAKPKMIGLVIGGTEDFLRLWRGG